MTQIKTATSQPTIKNKNPLLNLLAKIKKQNPIILLLITLLCPFNSTAKQVLIASGHAEYPPFMYREGNQIIGVGTDITRLIFAELGIEVKSIYAGAWNRVQRKAKSGDIDLIVGIYKTDERLSYLDYADEPYLAEPVGLFIHKTQGIHFSQWQDLIGKTGATVMGESFGQKFDEFALQNLSIQRLSSIVQSYKMIDRHRLDYSIYALYPGLIKLKENSSNLQVSAHKTPVVTQDAYQAISKKSPYKQHLPYFAYRLQQLKAQGIVQQLINRHMDRLTKKKNDRHKTSSANSEQVVND